MARLQIRRNRLKPLLGLELELGLVPGNQGVTLEIAGFQALQPIADKSADAIDTKPIVDRRVFLQIGVGELEERG